ncbi:MAG: hypothetical protein PUK13_00960 [Clostridiales bacterium]|nr:hypothetical protein [Clostridiales bacterium]MDY4622561.1 hypothetical protein [Eubacteriales bacterium]
MKKINAILALMLALGMLFCITGCGKEPQGSAKDAYDSLLLTGNKAGEGSNVNVYHSYEDFRSGIVDGLYDSDVEKVNFDDPESFGKFSEDYFGSHFLAVISVEDAKSGNIAIDRIEQGEDGTIRVYFVSSAPSDGAEAEPFSAVIGFDNEKYSTASMIEVYMDAKLQGSNFIDNHEIYNPALTPDDVKIVRGGYIEGSYLTACYDYSAFINLLSAAYGLDRNTALTVFGNGNYELVGDEYRVISQADIEALRGFDEAYFDTHFLVAVSISLTSGSMRTNLVDVVNEGGVIKIFLSTVRPGEVGTCDMVSDTVYIGLDRSVFSTDAQIEFYVNGAVMQSFFKEA